MLGTLRLHLKPVSLRPKPGKAVSGSAKSYLGEEIGISAHAPGGVLRRDSIVTGDEIAGNQGGTMKKSVWGPLVHVGQRVAALVAECNYAQTRLVTLQRTQSRF
jgi:hypothetical protein